MDLTKHPTGPIWCDGCGKPIAQGTTYKLAGDTLWHPSCFEGRPSQ